MNFLKFTKTSYKYKVFSNKVFKNIPLKGYVFKIIVASLLLFIANADTVHAVGIASTSSSIKFATSTNANKSIGTVLTSNSSTSSLSQPFLKNLQFGEKHEDVRRLQQFLNTNGFVVSSLGVGSLGNESMVYGLATLRAVKRFQEANRASVLEPVKLKNGTGVFSTSTRNFVNSLIKIKNNQIGALGYNGIDTNPRPTIAPSLSSSLLVPAVRFAGASYSLGGSISGLFGTVILSVDRLLNTGGGQTLTLNRDGQFTFGTAIPGGSEYAVSVRNNPINPAQNCTVTNATGVITTDISNLQVACVASVTPTVNISVSSANVAEDGNTSLVYTVSLSEPVATTTIVNLSTTGTALSGSDYSGAVSTILIPAGSASGTITIDPTADSTVENNEIVKIRIKSGSGYIVGTSSSSTAQILNDDTASASGTTLFIKQQGSDYLYSYDKTTWSIMMWPFTVQNLTPGTLTVKFISDITITDANSYFVVINDNISFEGAAYNTSGKPTTVTIQDVSNYPGLIQNGTMFSDGYNTISISNISVNSSNSTSAPTQGWIGQAYFSKNATGNTISYCSANGSVSISGGGIVGAHANNITISNCYGTGNILNSSGGIVGPYSSGVTVTKSYTTGYISTDGGGIIGNSADSPVVTKSYTTGTISNRAGGIIGSDSSSATVNNSYSMGFLYNGGGGIIGSSAFSPTVLHSYTAGPSATNSGGIIAGSNSDGVSNYSEANNLGSAWSDVRANSVLVIGSDWISINANMPYKLRGTAYSPYSIAYETSVSQRVDAGDSTVGATDYYANSCTILTINGTSPSTYPNITAEDATGIISTTGDVTAGDYEIVTYCINDDLEYAISSFNLTVI